jgi:hypothetical protein
MEHPFYWQVCPNSLKDRTAPMAADRALRTCIDGLQYDAYGRFLPSRLSLSWEEFHTDHGVPCSKVQ